ncbi:MAG: flagellar biosynthetic protein FliO [Burkholderiales bacterium]|jgi:flagellar protein FliO/FliZ|nr:flagellar biosynthetic protein FliO [Burkholderiales bacterium]
MTQALVSVALFMAAMAALPWLVRRFQQRQAGGAPGGGMVSKVVSAVAVGPHQRVVTVEVGPENARTLLVLGVTAQNIQCLHVLAGPAAPADVPDFAHALQEQTRIPAPPEPHHAP